MNQRYGLGWEVAVEQQDAVLSSNPYGDRVQVFAHRGSPAPGRPENSVAAVTEAMRLGADGVEVDVRLTDTRGLVCSHDPVDGLDVARLAALAELLAAVQRHDGARVIVEAKRVADVAVALRTGDALSEVLRAVTGRTAITVSSFDPVLLAVIRTACADLPVRTALLGDTSAVAAAVVRRASEDGHDEVHLPLDAVRRTPQVVELARWLGLSVTVWTVNRGHDLRRAARLGVDAVITDDVPRARDQLNRVAARDEAAFAA